MESATGNRTNGGMAILRWWPIIGFVLLWVTSGLGAYYSVKADLKEEAQRISAVETTLSDHEIRQRQERAELLAEIHELRSDIKTLIERQAAFLRQVR